MKIAILSPFYPFRGGIAQFSDRLYTELIKEHEVKAFTFRTLYPNFLFPGKTQYVTDKDPAIVIEPNRVLSSVNPFSYIGTAKKINDYSPDILIVAYWMSFLAPALTSVCRLINKKTKVVSLIHNAIPHEKRFFDKFLAKIFFKSCDAHIVLSEPVKYDLLKLVPNAKVMLSPHPIYDQYGDKLDKESACKTLDISLNKKTLLFFGLIREYKGLDILIEAMDELDETYQLIIAGESYDDFSKYQKLIDRSPLKSNIKVLEQYIPDNMVTTLFSASDVLVLPYRSATQSGVIAIAYYFELPMIATNVGALGDTILFSGTGIVTDDITPEALSMSIKSYFKDSSKQIEFLENIKSEKKRLSWEVFTQALNSFIDKLT